MYIKKMKNRHTKYKNPQKTFRPFRTAAEQQQRERNHFWNHVTSSRTNNKSRRGNNRNVRKISEIFNFGKSWKSFKYLLQSTTKCSFFIKPLSQQAEHDARSKSKSYPKIFRAVSVFNEIWFTSRWWDCRSSKTTTNKLSWSKIRSGLHNMLFKTSNKLIGGSIREILECLILLMRKVYRINIINEKNPNKHQINRNVSDMSAIYILQL